jgi:hypothetical protein
LSEKGTTPENKNVIFGCGDGIECLGFMMETTNNDPKLSHWVDCLFPLFEMLVERIEGINSTRLTKISEPTKI